MKSKIKEVDKKFVREIMNLHKKSIFPLWRKLRRDYNVREVRAYIANVFEKGKIFGYVREKKCTFQGADSCKATINFSLSILKTSACYKLHPLGWSGTCFFDFENKKLVGCGGVTLEKNHRVGDVCLVLVDPKHQRKGIGREIMKKIEDYSKSKVKKLRLNVLIKNKAVKFYEKLGYKKEVYIMEKNLK